MIDFLGSFSWTELFKATTVLFAVIDIIGSVPIIIKIKETTGELHPVRASFVSFGINEE